MQTIVFPIFLAVASAQVLPWNTALNTWNNQILLNNQAILPTTTSGLLPTTNLLNNQLIGSHFVQTPSILGHSIFKRDAESDPMHHFVTPQMPYAWNPAFPYTAGIQRPIIPYTVASPVSPVTYTSAFPFMNAFNPLLKLEENKEKKFDIEGVKKVEKRDAESFYPINPYTAGLATYQHAALPLTTYTNPIVPAMTPAVYSAGMYNTAAFPLRTAAVPYMLFKGQQEKQMDKIVMEKMMNKKVEKRDAESFYPINAYTAGLTTPFVQNPVMYTNQFPAVQYTNQVVSSPMVSSMLPINYYNAQPAVYSALVKPVEKAEKINEVQME